MTDYTKDEHALPYPEGGNKVAVHGDIQALAVKTGVAISVAAARTAAHADAEVALDRMRISAAEQAIPKALSDAKLHTETEVTKDRLRLAQAEAADATQAADIRKTLRDALAYADAKAADISRELDTSHVALDVDGTPYYRTGSTTVKVLQDTDGTPFYEAA